MVNDGPNKQLSQRPKTKQNKSTESTIFAVIQNGTGSVALLAIEVVVR